MCVARSAASNRRSLVLGLDGPDLPLTPGMTLVERPSTPKALERKQFVVAHQTTEILGVGHDIARAGHDRAEDTFDGLAQDALGNVRSIAELSFASE